MCLPVSRYPCLQCQQFNLTVRDEEEDAKGELDILGSPIVLESHFVASGPRMLEERIGPELELTWESAQEV